LAAVVAAQPELPEAVRAGIVAMVETAPRRGSDGMQTVGNGYWINDDRAEADEPSRRGGRGCEDAWLHLVCTFRLSFALS